VEVVVVELVERSTPGKGSSSTTAFLSAAPIDQSSCLIYKVTNGTKGLELGNAISEKGVLNFGEINYTGTANY
jgi:hypothetical protein